MGDGAPCQWDLVTKSKAERSKRVSDAVRKALEIRPLTVPVDVEAIARDFGIDVRFQPFPETESDLLSGCLVRTSEGQVIIGVNARHHSNRQRFTIAHELGHFLLHAGKVEPVHVDRVFYRGPGSSDGKDPIEIEANEFAAKLLMPAAQLERDAEDLEALDDEDTIRDLAGKYAVSVQAMTLRLAGLGLLLAIEPTRS